MDEKQSLAKKAIHLCIIIVLIIGMIFIALISILKYDENGETNMPFIISKISVISTVDGKDVENSEYKWEKIINQNNDIYVYVEKNQDYKKTETIESVKLENFQIDKSPEKGKLKFYKQSENSNELYENTEQNVFQILEYKGAKSTNSKAQEISNQGGIISFRCSNNNIGVYQSNDDGEINYKELLKKANINEEQIKAKISFDIILKLNSGKSFKAENIELEIPNSNLKEQGTTGEEYEKIEDIVFKRIEN